MSRKDDDGGGLPPQGNPPQSGQADGCGTFRAVEEHAAALGIAAPVFAAVKQSKGWAAGKKVKQAEFEDAIKGFLNAPTGGK